MGESEMASSFELKENGADLYAQRNMAMCKAVRLCTKSTVANTA